MGNKVSKELLKTLNYNFSNVKNGGIIKQFIFTEDTTVEEAREFLNHYFPNEDFDSLVSVRDNTPEYIRIESEYGMDEYEYEFLDDGLCCPLFNKDTYKLCVTINLRTGEIVDYDKNNIIDGYDVVDLDTFKIVDEGKYSLLDKNMKVIKSYRGYVPNDVVPARDGYGDYITLRLKDNYVTNLYPYEEMDFKEFDDYEDDEDD